MNFARLKQFGSGILVPLAAWYLLCDAFEVIPSDLIPYSGEVARSFWVSVETGLFASDLISTIGRWIGGFSIGASLGVIVGFLLGLSERLWGIFELPLEFLRGIPVTAMLPLFFVTLGVGEESKIAMAALPSFLMLAVYTCGGVRRCSEERREMATVFGANRFQVFRYITFRESTPFLLLGIRLASSLSLTVAVVAEMFVGTESGIGQRIFESYMMNSMPGLFHNIIAVGVLGYICSHLVGQLELRSLHWVGQ